MVEFRWASKLKSEMHSSQECPLDPHHQRILVKAGRERLRPQASWVCEIVPESPEDWQGVVDSDIQSDLHRSSPVANLSSP